MSGGVLAGKKVAILVESQYIPGEIKLYQESFANHGATVELISRLWGNEHLTFIGEVENADEKPETLEVFIDLDQVSPCDYAAIIMAANYPSVRLRYFQPPNGQVPSPGLARSAPAVCFFAQAMQDHAIIKAAPCHGLWILTPTPELLAGRRVTCNTVLISDVYNAGAIYIAPPVGINESNFVVVDDDLITTTTWHASTAMIEKIIEAILAKSEQSATPEPSHEVASPPKPWKRRILVVLSEWGYWGEELVAPLEEFDRAAYQVDFCTPNGKRPNAITVSMDTYYVDPPLGRPVTTQEMAEKVREIDDPTSPQGRRLENPISLSDWLPERPYFASPNFVRGLEAYHRALDRVAADLNAYDALLIVGGSGPIVDLVNNQRLHDLILCFYRALKAVAAECYGVACLAFARDLENRKSIIWGKHVTGHCLEYDYKDGTGFMKSRGQFLDFNMGPPPYPLEFILRDATGPEGAYHGNFGKETSVIVDYPFITGRSTPDSRLTGQKLIETLDNDPPLRRWGW